MDCVSPVSYRPLLQYRRLLPSRRAYQVSKPKPSDPHRSPEPLAPSQSCELAFGAARWARQARESRRAEDDGAAGGQLHGEQHQRHQAPRGEDGSCDWAHVGLGAGQLPGLGAPRAGGGPTSDAPRHHQDWHQLPKPCSRWARQHTQENSI